MIFAFDNWAGFLPNGEIQRPITHGDPFNGLEDLPKGQDAWYGPAPPHLNQLLEMFDIEHEVMTTTQAIATNKPFYYLLETQGPPEGWLGTKPDSKNTLFSGMSHLAIQAAQNKLCKIILWSANEGYDPFQFKIFEKIHDEIHNYSIDSRQFVFVSANLNIQILYGVWRTLNNKGNVINVIPFNNEIFDDYEKIQPIVKFDEESSKRDKYFLLLNRAPRIHRMAFISWLHSKLNVEKRDFLVSYPSEDLAPYKFSKKSHLSNYFKYHLHTSPQIRSDSMVAWKDLVDNHLPLIADVEEWNTNHYITSVDWLYTKTFFSIVTESVYSENSLFLDEKTYKPIFNYHPFIIVGTPHALKKLKEWGFKTFSHWIDESYDDEFHPGTRMEMIINEIVRLTKLPLSDWKDIYKEMVPILKHNKKQLEIQQNKKLVDELLRRL